MARTATSATNLSFDGFDCGDSIVGVSKVTSQRRPPQLSAPGSLPRPASRHSSLHASLRSADSGVFARPNAAEISMMCV